MKLFRLLLVAIFAISASLSWADYPSPIYKNVTVNGVLQLNGGMGKFKATGMTAPTISACGVSPTITGYDNAIKLNMGTGALTTCSLNFGTTWTAAPTCVAFPANAAAAATGTTGAYVSATTTLTLTFTGANLTATAYNILCW